MDTNKHESEDNLLHRDWVFRDWVFRLVGCAFEVLNEVGHSLHVGLIINFKRAKLEWERIVL